jgi:serralysin
VLENYETALHQDLNGDGVIGIPSAAVTVIQTDVSTSLVQVGSNYFMYPVGGSSGPELSFNGAPVVAGAGQFSGWAPIGAVQTPTGYDVAWKDAATNQYSVWTTDSSGNFVSSTGAIAPTSTTLETYETTLHQDLNGDGFVGIPPAPVRSAASSSAVSQAVSVKIASSDTFIFGGGPGAGDVAPNTGTMGHDAWIAGGHPAAWMQETPASELLAQTHSMVEGHGTIINPGNHDGSAAMNFHFIDLHASHFII